MNNSFAIDIIPENDGARLAVLDRYRLLDTPAEQIFDNMTLLAAATFQTPVALISLVDAETVFFKSTFGVGKLRCTDRGESLCALAILKPEVLVFENTLSAPEVSDSVPVKSGVRFYAGAPLKTADGFLIGTICIAGFEPRTFNAGEHVILESLARVVMEQIDLRLSGITRSEQQNELLEQKDEFISIASHELKTPLTSLTASLQLLERMQQEGKSDPSGKMIIQANKSLQKLNKLVADLLNVKRIATGNLTLNRTVFTIGHLIDDCCGHVRQAGEYHITLTGDTQLAVFADEQKIDQVLVNLVNNAVKYAPLSKKIQISVSRQDEFARIAARDEGPGISHENQTRIFERYYRSQHHNVSGLGLGLYIIAEIIKQHGGEVGVESESGKGSTFWFTIPLAEE